MESTTPNDKNRDILSDETHRDGSFKTTVNPNYQSERESWKEMFQTLYVDINRLWQKENLLVRTELNEKISDIKVAASSFATGGAVLLVGLFAAVATSIIILDLFLPLWASALIVTVVLLIVGGVMVAGAKKKFEANRLKPTHSLETMSEIKNTFQEKFHEFKRH
jgi:uncharacterized protein YacL